MINQPENLNVRMQPKLWLQLWHNHAPLALFSLVMLAFTLFFAVGVVADSRTITGQPAWLKPTKFGLSITIYTLTITWMLGFIRTERLWLQRVLRVATWAILLTLFLEIVVIAMQAARGIPSHFNVSTALNTLLWSLMATAIFVLWIANFLLAAVLLFQPFDNPTLAWGIRSGLLIAIVGMGLGYLMTMPTAQQLANWQDGGAINIVGAHSVGAPDGGSGLPFLGWRTDVGDLRVGHFVGMHALQLLPFLAWWISRRRRWSLWQQKAMVATLAVSYLALTLLVTWQALRAQALFAPDGLTLAVLAAIIGGAVTALLYLAHPNRVRSMR